VLEKSSDGRLPSVARAAASPAAIVLAGGGVAIGLAAHLGVAVTVLLGAAGYGARVGWAAVHRRMALRKRAERHRARIDPWSVPEPWRGYTKRALDARKRYRQLVTDCPAGPVAEYLAGASAKVDAAVDEHWALAQSGAALAGPPGRAEKVTEELAQVQRALSTVRGADRSELESRESALASELRSLRHLESVSAQMSSRLSDLTVQLVSLVADAGELVATTGAAGTDLSSLSAELTSLTRSLDEARRLMATAPPGPADS
jgi:hypothetical protein